MSNKDTQLPVEDGISGLGTPESGIAWQVELVVLKKSLKLTRENVYDQLDKDCLKLLVCDKKQRITTVEQGDIHVGETSMVTHATQHFHICALLHRAADERFVRELLESKFGQWVLVKEVRFIASWRNALRETSAKDLDALMKNVDEEDLHHNNRLWLKVLREDGEELPAYDPLYLELANRHIAVKSAYSALRERYTEMKDSAQTSRCDQQVGKKRSAFVEKVSREKPIAGQCKQSSSNAIQQKLPSTSDEEQPKSKKSHVERA